MTNFSSDGKWCIERELNVNVANHKCESLSLQFDINETCNWIELNKFRKVCLQFPDELLNVSSSIYEEIKKILNVDLYILGDTTYASCCVDSVAAMHVQAEAVIHYGHTCFSKTDIPVFTVLPKEQFSIDSAFKIIEDYFKDDDHDICLFYGQEFEHCKDEIINNWYKIYSNGCVAHIDSEDSPYKFTGRIIKDKNGEQKPCEILKDYNCIYVGSSESTIFNYAISVVAKDWFHYQLSSNKINRMNETMWFKRRRYLIEKCKDANSIGILVCKQAGDQTRDVIKHMKELCKVNGKKSYIIYVGKPNVAKLANFPEIDIYVMIACPENDLYSSRDFYKPIVYPFELEVALNSNREPYYTHHITDYDLLLPGKKYYCDVEGIKQETDVSLITGKIREIKSHFDEACGMELVEKENWAVESIGSSLNNRSWKGLEQRLGETEVKKVDMGRKGIPLYYSNEL